MVSTLTGPGPSGNVVLFTVGYTEFLEDTFSSIAPRIATMANWLCACHWTQSSCVQTRTRRWIFKDDKIWQNAFFRRRRKSIGPVSQEYFPRTNSSFPSPFLPACYEMTLRDRIPRELWWTNQEFCSVDIIQP
jgi:hypothetical protein